MLGWFHRLGSPKTFFGMAQSWPKTFGLLSLLLLASGTVWGLLFAPPDYQQGHSVRIMYVHVPAAAVAQSCYLIMAISSAVFLIWNIKLADWAAKSMAPIGASLAFLVLITGAIWGKPTWGTWWVWDARLTSTLVLLLLYLGIIALRNALEEKGNDGRPCAVLALVGLVNLPIIKYSVDWWFTLHQPASFTLTEKPKMPPEMWIPLLLMAAGYYLFVFSVWTSRIRNEIISRERKTAWAKAWAGPQ